MKTWKLFLCSLVPMAFGELTNRLILVPFLGMLLFYAAPLVMAAVSVALLLVLFSCGYLAERIRRSRAAG